MNFGALLMLFLLAICGVFGLFMIAANVSQGQMVDSYNNTTTVYQNLTKSNMTAMAPMAGYLGGFVVIIIAIMFLVSVVIMLMKNTGGGGRR